MKWFFKWIRHGLQTIDKEDRAQESDMAIGLALPKVNRIRATAAGRSNDGINLNTSSMNFRIYPATGGHIVEYQYYNEKTDRQDQALHLIPSELDLGSELAKIMTLEALKR